MGSSILLPSREKPIRCTLMSSVVGSGAPEPSTVILGEPGCARSRRHAALRMRKAILENSPRRLGAHDREIDRRRSARMDLGMRELLPDRLGQGMGTSQRSAISSANERKSR